MKSIPISGETLPSPAVSNRVVTHPASIRPIESHNRNNFHLHRDFFPYTSDIHAAVERFETWGEIYPVDGPHRLKAFEIGTRRAIVKKFEGISVMERIRHRLGRTSPARLAYDNAMRLREMDVETPLPIAFVEEHGAIGLRRALYLAAEHSSASTISVLFCRTRHFDQREQALRAFAAFVHRLHERGIAFHRLEADNILLYQKADGWHFVVLSTQNVRFRRPSGLAERMRTFARLYSDAALLQVLAEAYALESGERPELALRLLQQAVKREQRKGKFLGWI